MTKARAGNACLHLVCYQKQTAVILFYGPSIGPFVVGWYSSERQQSAEELSCTRYHGRRSAAARICARGGLSLSRCIPGVSSAHLQAKPVCTPLPKLRRIRMTTKHPPRRGTPGCLGGNLGLGFGHPCTAQAHHIKKINLSRDMGTSRDGSLMRCTAYARCECIHLRASVSQRSNQSQTPARQELVGSWHSGRWGQKSGAMPRHLGVAISI